MNCHVVRSYAVGMGHSDVMHIRALKIAPDSSSEPHGAIEHLNY